MIAPGLEADHIREAGDGDRRAAVGDGSVAQLPGTVGALCPHGSVRLQRQAVGGAPARLTTFVRPETVTGVLRLVVVPSPSCPVRLSPQARTVPSVFKARLWPPPPAILAGGAESGR